MKIQILHKITRAVLFEHECENNSIKLTLELAVSKKAYLPGADLRGAYLPGADLRGADLTGAYLTGAYLTGAYLTGANLTGAYLPGASLSGVRLTEASLRGANLTEADLRGADLYRANLHRADLIGANLRGVRLHRADLIGADLTGANLTEADLTEANLRGAYLDTIKDDFIDVISRLPNEVPALIAALKEGRVDGTAYEGSCSCLVGTLATAKGVSYRKLSPDSSRPAERFFMAIQEGDTPETNQVSQVTLEWAKEWLAAQPAQLKPRSKR